MIFWAGDIVPEYVFRAESADPPRLVFGVDVEVESFDGHIDVYPRECLSGEKILINVLPTSSMAPVVLIGAPTTFHECRKFCQQPEHALGCVVSFGPATTQKIICFECKAENLENFMTSKRDNRTICRPCFDSRAEKRLAKEVTV